MTHTYAALEVSAPAYDEIAAKLREAGYSHAFDSDTGAIDMHGIGLMRAAPVASDEISEDRPASSGQAPSQYPFPRFGRSTADREIHESTAEPAGEAS